jgi:hypothetical protein
MSVRGIVGAVVGLALVSAGVSAPAHAVAVPDLPAGVAAAALRSEPALPVPAGWTFPDAFSRTSGTGRSIGGAFEWSDWVFDAYGASSSAGGLPLNQTTSETALTPAQGQYLYPDGKAAGDGADIFRAAVGLTRSDTVWRVDWNTLQDPSIPIAEWTFDTDDDATTGGAAWPAGANVTSPGIERALVVSAEGARLIDVASGATLATFPTTVDAPARSFVVRVPRSALAIGRRWRIRLAAGLADAAGTGFAVPTTSAGGPASDTAPRVYNVTFRTAAQEPPVFSDGQSGALASSLHDALAQLPGVGGYAQELTNVVTANFWGEDDQADALARGDVSAFSAVVDWRRLAARRRTDPPLVKGWSSRWYVTDLDLGQGVAGGGAYPAYVGRVQPYAVYVPRSYTGRRAVPLTWMLHSASSNYLQYAALNPRMAQELCATRRSICATPNGFGGGALYGGDVSEHDVWQVWRQLARDYRLATDRTVVSGYSAGGVGSFRMSHTYPSVFSAAMPLDGGFEEACSSGQEGPRNFVTALAPDRSANVRWVPEVMSSSYFDELSLYPAVVDQARRFQAAGDRFSLFSTTMGEHLVSAVADGFAVQVRALRGTPRLKTRPGTIDYSWCPQNVDAKSGLGPTSVYWLSGLAQRDTGTPSTMSRVVATDGALPEPKTTEQVANSVATPPDSPPMHVLTGSWTHGERPAATRTLTLTLTNVKSLAVDVTEAKLPRGRARVTTDGATTLRLARVPHGTRVTGPGGAVTAGREGSATIELPAGSSDITWAP